MNGRPEQDDDRRDWRISVTLIAIWVIAVCFVFRQREDVPLSMLAVASLFFVMLVPAMNDLVRSIDKRFRGSNDT